MGLFILLIDPLRASAEAAKSRCGPAPNAGHPAKLEKTTPVGALKASQQEKG